MNHDVSKSEAITLSKSRRVARTGDMQCFNFAIHIFVETILGARRVPVQDFSSSCVRRHTKKCCL